MKKNNIVKLVWICKASIYFSNDVFSCNLSNVNPLKYVSMSKEECKLRPEIVSIDSDEPTFYLYSLQKNKCSGSCNDINGPYAKICIPNAGTNINLKIFHLISRKNETRYIELHETCKCKGRLDASVCNNK